MSEWNWPFSGLLFPQIEELMRQLKTSICQITKGYQHWEQHPGIDIGRGMWHHQTWEILEDAHFRIRYRLKSGISKYVEAGKMEKETYAQAHTQEIEEQLAIHHGLSHNQLWNWQSNNSYSRANSSYQLQKSPEIDKAVCRSRVGISNI